MMHALNAAYSVTLLLSRLYEPTGVDKKIILSNKLLLFSYHCN